MLEPNVPARGLVEIVMTGGRARVGVIALAPKR